MSIYTPNLEFVPIDFIQRQEDPNIRSKISANMLTPKKKKEYA